MPTIEQDIAAIRTAVYGKDVREAIADGLEHVALTFDATPTSGSGKPVTSGGLYTSVKAPLDTLTSENEINERVVATLQKSVVAGGVSVFSIPIFNVANGKLRISVSNTNGAVFKRGDEYVAAFYHANDGINYAQTETGTISLGSYFVINPALNFDCNKVNLRLPYSASGTSTCTVTYTPGAVPKDALVLKDDTGEVTMTAAKLRQLLNLVS